MYGMVSPNQALYAYREERDGVPFVKAVSYADSSDVPDKLKKALIGEAVPEEIQPLQHSLFRAIRHLWMWIRFVVDRQVEELVLPVLVRTSRRVPSVGAGSGAREGEVLLDDAGTEGELNRTLPELWPPATPVERPAWSSSASASTSVPIGMGRRMFTLYSSVV